MKSFTLKSLFGSNLSLGFALVISLALHGITFTLHFQFPDALPKAREKALDIILVNSKSANRPTQAQALAQANLDGGGNVDQDRRASTPLPPTRQQNDGTDLERTQRRIRELESEQQKLTVATKSKLTTPATVQKSTQPDPTPVLSGRDLAEQAKAMARLEAEIGKSIEEYNSRPRKRFLGTRTDEYRFAQYVEDWRLKVERIGTLNYPEAARGKLYGTLVLTVTISLDGSVLSIEIDRSSGHKILDDAARRIVNLASPFAPFPPNIRRDTDLLVITRTWSFTRGDALETRPQ
ncbi:MAG: hypothetical protein RIR00_2571 [Pseudomonadota bacterium]|jgi:protein TonB